jgi:hypothetical protein
MNWDDGNALHPVAILVFVAILFPVALWFEHRDRKRAERERDEAQADAAGLRRNVEQLVKQRNEDAYRRLYRDILAESAPVQRVQPVVFQTGLPRGSVCGYAVRAHNVVEAAEIVSQSPAFKSRAA